MIVCCFLNLYTQFVPNTIITSQQVYPPNLSLALSLYLLLLFLQQQLHSPQAVRKMKRRKEMMRIQNQRMLNTDKSCIDEDI